MSSRALPPLNALRAFEAAARLQSISQAAAQLHVTHGAISRHVRTLEEDLGRPLFVREGRGLSLTADGVHLRDAASLAFDQLQQAYTQLRRGNAPAALVLGCPGSVLARWVIPRLEQLGSELPEVKLHLSAQENGFDPLLGGADAALLLGEAPWPAQWQVHCLAAERIGPVLSPHHAHLSHLQHTTAAALLEEPLLHTTSRPQAWPHWFAAQQLGGLPVQLGTGFDHLTYLLEAAAAGLGVAIAPEQLVSADLHNGRLLAPWGFAETGGQWVLCALRGNNDPRIRLLAQWLRTELQKS